MPAEGGEASSGTPGSQSAANGKPHPPADNAEPSSVAGTRSAPNETKPAAQPSPPGNGIAAASANGSGKPPASKTALPPSQKNGNGTGPASGFNQLRNEFLTVARRVATSKKQPIAEVVEWASGGAFKYGDVGRMSEADVPKLRAAAEVLTSGLNGTAH